MALRLLVFISVFFLLPPFSFLLARSSQDDRPLPDPERFYERVRENLARAERVNDLYTYKERRTDVHTNPFGKIGTDGTSLFEVYPSPARRLTYRRLIARDGMLLGAPELAEQDRQYRARVADAEPEQSTSRADERRRLEEAMAAARERAQRAIDDVVNALAFKLERRTVYNGVPAILITFTPKGGVKPSTRQGRAAQKFAGAVWVDERSAEVMFLEAKSIDSLSYGLGIVARLGEGTTATVTRRAVDDEVWMPTKLTLTGRGRAALFRKLVVDYEIEWFDYRRLPGNSLAPFLDLRVHGQPGGSPQ